MGKHKSIRGTEQNMACHSYRDLPGCICARRSLARWLIDCDPPAPLAVPRWRTGFPRTQSGTCALGILMYLVSPLRLQQRDSPFCGSSGTPYTAGIHNEYRNVDDRCQKRSVDRISIFYMYTTCAS